MILSHKQEAIGDLRADECNIHSSPTEQVNPTDSAWQPHKGDRTLMENTQEELKTHLMQSDDEFRQLAEQHHRYHEQLEALEAKSHLTPQEEVEEHRLKKVKLQLKDQMNEIISRYRTQHV
jgi:uncharacterized protein YdcH (DUF465 family)